MRTFLILTILFLSACGGPLKVAPEAQALFNQFADDAVASGRNVSYADLQIVFEPELGPTVYGKCNRSIKSFFGGYRTLVLNRRYWDNAPESSRKLVLYHELGHCVLGQGHHGHEIMQASISENGFYFNEALWIEHLFQD